MPESGLPSILERVGQHPRFRKLQEILKPVASHPIWWFIHQPHPKRLDYREACKSCPYVRSSKQKRSECQRQFLDAIAQAHNTQHPVTWECPIGKPALAVPISQDNQPTGVIAMCHTDRPFAEGSAEMAHLVIETLVYETEKERELTNLYESIQPRCMALSTIHTIHRLMSTTYSLDELLPRLARLCAQVMRVRRCSIALIDEESKHLVLRALADARYRNAVQRPMRLGQGIQGRVASTLKSYLRDRILVVPLMDQDCIGVITVEDKQHNKPLTAFDQEILTTLAEQAVVAISNARLYAQQERVTLGTVKSLASILDTLDSGNGPKQKPNTQFLVDVVLAISDEMGLGVDDRRSLHYAALLHDAGRVTIPDEILLKRDRLSGKELKIVRQHPVMGVELMRPLEVLEPAIPIILHHHERYDGSGYPNGLKGDNIPFGARVMAVANAFEAMICERPYREALSIDQAAREIEQNSGTQFDPKVVEAFLRLVHDGKMQRLLTPSRASVGSRSAA